LTLVLLAMSQIHLVPGRPTATGARALHPGAYWLFVAFEAIAIPLAVTILKRRQKPQYILPAIAVLVGLHFFGLVPAFGFRVFAWIGAAMCALALLTIWALPSSVSWELGGSARQVDLWALVVGLGCAVLLWCTALLLISPGLA
jgi:hypothetical protein